MSKKGKHKGNVYQQRGKDGWIIRWRDAHGRRRSRLVKVDSEEDARKSLFAEKSKAEKAFQLEAVLGQKPPTEESFEAFSKEFLKFQEKRISPRVVKGKISHAEYERQAGIEKHLLSFFGSMKLAAIRKADVVRYIQTRIGEVSDGTIIKEVNVLKRIFSVAMDLDKVSANPAQRAPLPKTPECRTRYLLPDEWRKVFALCHIEPTDDGTNPEQWLQQAAGLAVSLGTRRGELMHVTIPDVDLGARRVTLRKTKNGKTRTVFINDLAFQVFTSMGIAERKKKNDRRVLFPGVTPEQLSMRFIRACRAAGVEDFSLHDLRHTYASHLKMNGADLYDLQRLLGHSDPRMTTRYAHLGQDHLDAAASRLDGVLTLPAVPESQEAAK